MSSYQAFMRKAIVARDRSDDASSHRRTRSRSRSRDRIENENRIEENYRNEKIDKDRRRSPASLPADENLGNVQDDPRIRGDGQKLVKMKGGGRNTESFDPKSTLVRPGMRIIVGQNKEEYGKPLKHDDVVICPDFLCSQDDWKMYYDLVQEMRDAQNSETKDSEWISWAEGAHLISKNPSGSPSYMKIQEKIAKYFDIEMKSVGTRFNWYRDSSDWKPLHHDSAAFNPQRARNQNITVGVSLGSTRELVFMHAKTGERLYFPQTNGMLFSFGRDVNIHYKHGVNALPEDEQDGKGRVSIILWGKVKNVIEERGSPRILDDNTRGGGYSLHAPSDNRRTNGDGRNDRRGVCRDFQQNRCSRGASCRFSHTSL